MTDTMTFSDDELISAYLDRELPDAEADALTERLASEPQLMQRLEAMRSADAAVRGIYEQLDRTPVPSAVLDLFDAERETDNVVAFPARGIKRFFEAPVAIAASVALIAGFLGATLVRQDALPDASGTLLAGAVQTDTNLYELLESAPSGEVQDVPGGAAEVVLTFADVNGDWCRQVRIDAPGQSMHGVACRRKGSWQLETIALGAAGTPGGQFGTAAGATPGAIDAAVDGLIGDGAPLEKGEENSVISRGWK